MFVMKTLYHFAANSYRKLPTAYEVKQGFTASEINLTIEIYVVNLYVKGNSPFWQPIRKQLLFVKCSMQYYLFYYLNIIYGTKY